MKKKFATIISFLAVSILLVACGNFNNTDKEDSGGDSDVLKIAYPSWWEDWFKEAKDDFEDQNEGIEVELIPLYDDTTTKQDMMMQSAETAPDVAVEDTYILNSDVNAGYLSSMQEMVDNWEDWENIEDTVKEGVTSEDGEIYGVPFSTDVQGLWYNRELFKEAGLSEDFQPEAWEDVLDAAKKLKDSNENIIPLFIYSTKSNEEATSMRTFQMLYSGTGSELYEVPPKDL